jgi:formylglycine-generating enzyme required for sulfatase activity
MRSVLLVLATAVLLSCGPGEEEVRKAREENAREAAAEKRRAAADEDLLRAGALAGQGRYGEAWAAWRAAREVLGETPALIRLAARIKESEALLRRDEAYAALQKLLARDRDAATDEERLAALREATKAAREFLATWPNHDAEEEIRAAVEYSESEIDKHDRFVALLTAARKHLAEGRAERSVKTAREAIAVLDRKEAREVVTEAQRALTPTGMVFIPEGTFPCGKGKEKTYLPAFYIDVYEVTNEEYARFVKGAGHAAPKHFKDGMPPVGQERHPVVNVNLEDALAYAAWAGKRIPTEIQWERGARGTPGREFPWGDEWIEGKGNFAKGGTQAVGSLPFDRSPDGLFDMGGNVMELTLDHRDPAGTTAGPIMKGGHWSSDFHKEYARTWARWPVDRKRLAVDSGFRCVKPAP